MKIAICTVGELYGGVEQWVYSYLEYIINHEKEIDPTVILLNEGELSKRLKGLNAEVLVLKRKYKYDLSIFCKIKDILQKKEISIIHTHGYQANILFGLVGKFLRKPLIKTIHGNVEVYSGLNLPSIRLMLNNVVDNSMSLFFNKRVFVSRDLLKKQHKRSVVIYNAINPINIKGAYYSFLDDNNIRVASVGRLSAVKGYRYLIEAVVLNKEFFIKSKVKVFFLGEGELLSSLKELCVKEGIDEFVEFMGFRSDVYELMTKMDIFVMPSLHEGLPFSLLEMMYLKKPIIASRVGGIAEIMENEKDSLLVPPKDSREISNALMRLIENPPLAKRLGNNAFEKVKKDFLMEVMVRKYRKCYKEIIYAVN